MSWSFYSDGFPNKVQNSVFFILIPTSTWAAATSAMQWLYRAEPQWQLLTLFQASADLTEFLYRRWRRGSEADHLPGRLWITFRVSLSILPIKLSKQTRNPQYRMIHQNPLSSLVYKCACIYVCVFVLEKGFSPPKSCHSSQGLVGPRWKTFWGRPCSTEWLRLSVKLRQRAKRETFEHSTTC